MKICLPCGWMFVRQCLRLYIHIVQHFKDHQFTLFCRLPSTHFKIQTCTHKYLFWLLSWFLPNWQLNSAHKAIRQWPGQMWCRGKRTCLSFFFPAITLRSVAKERNHNQVNYTQVVLFAAYNEACLVASYVAHCPSIYLNNQTTLLTLAQKSDH